MLAPGVRHPRALGVLQPDPHGAEGDTDALPLREAAAPHREIPPDPHHGDVGAGERDRGRG